MTTDELENTYINLILTDPNIGFKGLINCNRQEIDEYSNRFANYMFKRDELKSKLNQKLYSIYESDNSLKWGDIRRNLLLKEIRELKLSKLL